MAALSDVYMTDLTDFLNFLAMSETFRFMEEMAEILNLLNAGWCFLESEVTNEELTPQNEMNNLMILRKNCAAWAV